MECLDTIKCLKINFKKKINTVVIVVEGAEYEFKLFKQIFQKVFHYIYVEKNRNQTEFKEYSEFIMEGNHDSRIIVVNTKNSNIGTVENDDDYRNDLYKLLHSKYKLDIKNIPVYYVWDRDNKSNDKVVVENLIKKLGNSYENDNYENGLLLLSYPQCESYTISNFKNKINYLDKNLKQYLKEESLKLSNIDAITVKKAVIDMHCKFIDLGILDYDLDNFRNTNLRIFKLEETIYEDKKMYRLLSLISIIFLDLGIITAR